MIVEKRLVLVEEVHIRRTTSSRVVEMPVTLRKQKAVIDSIPSERQTARQEDRKPLDWHQSLFDLIRQNRCECLR
jgi:stress response protein YsnF